MAKVVLGVASSHSPQLNVPATEWALLREKDETDRRLDYAGLLRRAKAGIEADLAPEVWQRRYDVCQGAVAALGRSLKEAAPDAIVIFGDDQQEQFRDDNMPMFCVFRGERMSIEEGHRDRPRPAWAQAERLEPIVGDPEKPGHPELAEHIIRSLARAEFDLSTSNALRQGRGLGHAFSFLYRRLWPECTVPMVPVMLNTFYPPNQPTPKRCYDLGRAVRAAIESWPGGGRVALLASGGLSHVVIDEEFDRTMIGALQRKDAATLCGLPQEKFYQGTSESLCWIALAGAAEDLPMRLLGYEPSYRSPAGTGCGMTFAEWSAA
jgi:3-O-methylgallate 3,4-dioxygenase